MNGYVSLFVLLYFNMFQQRVVLLASRLLPEVDADVLANSLSTVSSEELHTLERSLLKKAEHLHHIEMDYRGQVALLEAEISQLATDLDGSVKRSRGATEAREQAADMKQANAGLDSF